MVENRRGEGGSSSIRAAVGWASYDALADQWDAQAVYVEASNPNSPAFQYCESTANSTGDRGFLRMQGSRSSTSAKTIVAEALPPGQFGLLLSGSATGFVPTPGGRAGNLCLGGDLGRYNATVAAANAAGVILYDMDSTAIPTSGGLQAALVGQFYQWQVWHRGIVSGTATSNDTNAVTILFL